MRPPPALIVTTRLLRYTFLPCAGERTAAAAVEPRVGRGNGLLARRCYVPARSWRVQGCACGVQTAGRRESAAPTIVSLIVTPTTRSQCVCSASTPATVTPSVLAYTG